MIASPVSAAMTLQAIADRYHVRLDQPSPIRLNAGRADLPRLCHSLGFTTGAEIGVWKGAYSEQFCKAMPGVAWHAIDTWAPYAAYRETKNDAALIHHAYAEARLRLAPFHCAMMRMSSLEAAEQIPDGSLDVIYIDGNHEASFVLEDLEAWTPKLRSSGILAGHDYRVPPKSKAFIQVKAAVDQYVAKHTIAPWFLFAGDKTPSFFWVIT